MSGKKYAAKEGYQDARTARNYDKRRFTSLRGRIGDWLDKRAIEKALNACGKINNSVLDIPCGTGRIAELLLKKGFTVTGADISDEMISVARKKLRSLSHLKLLKADVESMPFADAEFDCIISIRFMGHIPRQNRVNMLKEMKRASRNFLIIEYCVKQALPCIERRLRKYLKRERLPLRWPWQIISKKELEDEAKAAGLRIVAVYAKLRYLSDSCMVLMDVRRNSL